MSSFFYAVPEEIQEQRDLCALIRLCEGVEENGDDESKMISSLLEKKPSFVSMEMHGVTPLLAAVSANNLKLIDVLCQFAEHHGEGGEGFVEYSYCSFLILDELQHFHSRTMAKWFYSTRLETRTKESTSIASVRVANLYAE